MNITSNRYNNLFMGAGVYFAGSITAHIYSNSSFIRGLTSMFRSMVGVLIIFNLRIMLIHKLKYKSFDNRALNLFS